jgi:hypothetical protein
LPRNLDIVELAILEFSQIMTEKIQWLDTRSGIQILLVTIPPLLKAPHIIIMAEITSEEVVLIIFLQTVLE